MRSFFHALLRRRPLTNNPQSQRANVSKSTIMAGGMTTAALYACTMTNPTALGAVPEESEAKAHHLKDGKGFINPWASWKDFSGPKLGLQMTW